MMLLRKSGRCVPKWRPGLCPDRVELFAFFADDYGTLRSAFTTHTHIYIYALLGREHKLRLSGHNFVSEPTSLDEAMRNARVSSTVPVGIDVMCSRFFSPVLPNTLAQSGTLIYVYIVHI